MLYGYTIREDTLNQGWPNFFLEGQPLKSENVGGPHTPSAERCIRGCKSPERTKGGLKMQNGVNLGISGKFNPFSTL